MFESAEYRLYGALAHAAVWDHATPEQRPRHFDSVLDHHRQLQAWAEVNPETFEDRAALVGAEIARIEGRVLDAQELYDKAIREAHKYGFVHNQAIANEIAGRFYAERGYEKIAATYLRAARACYLRWGADGKVRQLEELYPYLKVDKSIPNSAATIVTPNEQLDLATVIRVSEAVSGEIVFEKLINTLMSSAIEHAGADRGLLILPRGDEYQIEAEATTSSDNVNVVLKQARVTAADLPKSVFHYVLRTKKSVLLHDASSQNSFSADGYIRDHRSRSVLCLPILKQTRLIGMLYLENNLSTAAFTPARMVVLTLLASQAAISIENASLYRELAEREARIRRLVDANIIGIFVWDPDGRIIDANEAFLRIVGYGSDDLVSGRLRWRDLTPTEWRDADDRRVAELEATGTAQPYEKEYFVKSGRRVPVLVGAATFGGRHDQGVAFVVDLTERKRAEEEIRESERRYSEMQMELVHANRVATIGHLSASIAHEVNQPIGATINNASAALHWLSKEPADLEKARQALQRIFANGNRVSEVVGRMRALFKKAPIRTEDVDINGAILEVIALTRGEVVKNSISVQSHLVDGLPLIQGDRVQLQQVIMNLIVNAVEALSSVSEGSRDLVITTGKGEPDGVLVVVRDSGPGLSSPGPERIFDAFNTTKPGGLGMGLSICRTIIEAHGGRLWATAAQPQGAIFQFTLPVQSSQSA
jgi:PAS domain S-box-containing protein